VHVAQQRPTPRPVEEFTPEERSAGDRLRAEVNSLEEFLSSTARSELGCTFEAFVTSMCAGAPAFMKIRIAVALLRQGMDELEPEQGKRRAMKVAAAEERVSPLRERLRQLKRAKKLDVDAAANALRELLDASAFIALPTAWDVMNDDTMNTLWHPLVRVLCNAPGRGARTKPAPLFFVEKGLECLDALGYGSERAGLVLGKAIPEWCVADPVNSVKAMRAKQRKLRGSVTKGNATR
jgi:hypothetical protein